MLEYLQRVGSQSLNFLKSQSPARIAAIAGTSVGILVVIVMLFVWAGEKTYVPLMTNLNPEDATNIMRVLRDKRIPYSVDSTGRGILVPPESINDLRLELSTMGMPQSSVVGYELFDTAKLGQTTFVQKINQKRALEGELMRTINSIRGVRRSRVHLAMPAKSTFVEDQKKSTASVVLDLDPGVQLNEKQVYGIGNLVARAVEGMDVTDVMIVDSNGKVLSKNPNDPLAAATATQFDLQAKVENDLEKRVETMLSRVVGDGKVVAKVTADLDFSQVNETQTIVDGDSATPLSVERRNDNMSGTRPGPTGLVGAASNAPGTPPAVNEIKTETTKANEVTNYVVPQIVRHTTKPQGTVKRLSVSVVLDGKETRSVDKEGKAQSKVVAWSPEQLKQFEDIVAGAVGLDKKRGDSLEITNMEFTHEDFDEAQRTVAEQERRVYIQNMALYGTIGLLIALFLVLVVRPFIKWLTENTMESVDSFLPQTIEELEKLQKSSALGSLDDSIPGTPDLDPDKMEGEMIKEKITSLVDANPHKAALILRDWLHEEKRKDADTLAGPAASA
ncbi:MAG: flagellar basal-body MS-ring/collar protein FliF [Oligoflexia bacterium]|nr:flagellar basal-body MS-ring/collar protein FliF [Oligoflexia bacterium]